VTYAPTYVTPGAVVVVNLATRTVVGMRALPASTNGATLAAGADGRLYVTAYDNADFSQLVFAIDPATMAFTGARVIGGQNLRLLSAQGAQTSCSAAVADERGRLLCAVNQGQSQSTALYEFDLGTGAELRHYATGGTGAVAIAVR
jgi:hypothetical protein